jgi:hypothetical protein
VLLYVHRFPSGTATANVIRTLFGIPPELPRQAVAEVEQAASARGPAVWQRPALTAQPALPPAAPGTPTTPATPTVDGRHRSGLDRVRTSPSEKLSGRRFSTDDIPFLDLRSAASLARADTASVLPSFQRAHAGATALIRG